MSAAVFLGCSVLGFAAGWNLVPEHVAKEAREARFSACSQNLPVSSSWKAAVAAALDALFTDDPVQVLGKHIWGPDGEFADVSPADVLAAVLARAEEAA